MRKFAIGVLSMFCLFAGLAVSAGSAAAQNRTPQQVTLTPATLSFDVRPGGSATAPTLLTNHSGATLRVTGIEINALCSSPSDCSSQFHVVSHGCGATLKNGENCQINVEFVPAAEIETSRATLKVTFDDSSLGQTRRVALTGVSRQ
jgi:hypothetical protein